MLLLMMGDVFCQKIPDPLFATMVLLVIVTPSSMESTVQIPPQANLH